MKHAFLCLGLIALSASWVSSARADDDGTDNVIIEHVEVGPPPPPSPLRPDVEPPPRVLDDWSDGDPVPPGYRRSSKPRVGLIVTGACIFGTMYSLSVLAAQDKDNAALAVPVLGPLLQLTGKHSDDATGILTIDALGQAAGAVMLLIGLSTRSTTLVRNDFAEVHVAPMMTKEGAGGGLVGRF